MKSPSVTGSGARSRSRARVGALAQLLLTAVLAALAYLLLGREEWWEAGLRALFPGERRVLFGRTPMSELVLEHLRIVGATLGIILLIALPLGVWLTRRSGRAFLPLASNLLAVGQTFPPVAVLALALPYFGFGLKPTLIALVAYGILPVTRNVIAGLDGVPKEVLEAARGMGMGASARLFRVELPLAATVIVAGLRVSAAYTIGTATVAPLIGAGGLGVPIIAGLTVGNPALIIGGALPVALLALLADFSLGRLALAVSVNPLKVEAAP